jgi:peptide/nickel transport system substrate-binding protein
MCAGHSMLCPYENRGRCVVKYGWLSACAAACAVLCVLVVGGCGRGNTSEATGTVTFLIETMPINLDPRIGTDAQSQHLDGLLFNSLVAHDERMNIVPDLAASWETPDLRTYIFHLKRGVQFHDGRALTSADVKFTFDSLFSGAVKSAKRGLFPAVDRITTPDDLTVVFHLVEPDASFLWEWQPIRSAPGRFGSSA